ncbi:hypothetical protein CSHISOI_09360 [Colletotrichum shisoi]|uniref:Uncharacterized protein n=1 Tax=Colletotrichum shisoi TaxID=2078593 RepID=A0A5Q4BGK2_9PEZI|nr:hypothetical protein CSHISOI_09360 [Colletotrichum shisoi]
MTWPVPAITLYHFRANSCRSGFRSKRQKMARRFAVLQSHVVPFQGRRRQ